MKTIENSAGNLGEVSLGVGGFLELAAEAWEKGGKEAALAKLQQEMSLWDQRSDDNKKAEVREAIERFNSGQLDAQDVRLRLNLIDGWDSFVQMSDPSSGDQRISIGQYREKRGQILDATPEQLEEIRREMWVWPNLRESTS